MFDAVFCLVEISGKVFFMGGKTIKNLQIKDDKNLQIKDDKILKIERKKFFMVSCDTIYKP